MKIYTLLFLILCVVTVSSCANFYLLHPASSNNQDDFDDYPKFKGQDDLQLMSIKLSTRTQLTAYEYTSLNSTATVIVSGGNASSVRGLIYYYRFLLGHQVNVIFFGFEGFDQSSGQASLSNMPQNARGVIEFARAKYPEQPVFYLAHSISTAIALCIADNELLDGIVLEATVNLEKMPFHVIGDGVASVLFNPFATLISDSVANEFVNCEDNIDRPPALFIHNDKDKITPFVFAKKIYNEYSGEKTFFKTKQAVEPDYHQSAWYDLNVQLAIFDFINASHKSI